jgi:hypothetical protein
MALFIQLASRTRPVGSARVDSKFSHLVNQRRSRQTQPIGRSTLASDQPVGLVQCFQNVFRVGVGKRACSGFGALRRRCLVNRDD